MSNKTFYKNKPKQGKLTQKNDVNSNISSQFRTIENMDFIFHKDIESNKMLILDKDTFQERIKSEYVNILIKYESKNFKIPCQAYFVNRENLPIKISVHNRFYKYLISEENHDRNILKVKEKEKGKTINQVEGKQMMDKMPKKLSIEEAKLNKNSIAQKIIFTVKEGFSSRKDLAEFQIENLNKIIYKSQLFEWKKCKIIVSKIKLKENDKVINSFYGILGSESIVTFELLVIQKVIILEFSSDIFKFDQLGNQIWENYQTFLEKLFQKDLKRYESTKKLDRFVEIWISFSILINDINKDNNFNTSHTLLYKLCEIGQNSYSTDLNKLKQKINNFFFKIQQKRASFLSKILKSQYFKNSYLSIDEKNIFFHNSIESGILKVLLFLSKDIHCNSCHSVFPCKSQHITYLTPNRGIFFQHQSAMNIYRRLKEISISHNTRYTIICFGELPKHLYPLFVILQRFFR